MHFTSANTAGEEALSGSDELKLLWNNNKKKNTFNLCLCVFVFCFFCGGGVGGTILFLSLILCSNFQNKATSWYLLTSWHEETAPWHRHSHDFRLQLSPWSHYLWSCCVAWTRTLDVSTLVRARAHTHSQEWVRTLLHVLGRSINHPKMLPTFTGARWNELPAHWLTLGECMVLTDRQQTHQVPVKTHHEVALEIFTRTETIPATSDRSPVHFKHAENFSYNLRQSVEFLIEAD